MRSREYIERCDICNKSFPGVLEAAHIIDLALRKKLEEQYDKGDKTLPVSVNDADNGLLLCPTCHAYFDRKNPEIRIKPDGTIVLYGDCKRNKYENLNNKKVAWVAEIGTNKAYPSASLLRYAMTLKPTAGKRKRELIDESEEEAEVKLNKRSRTKK